MSAIVIVGAPGAGKSTVGSMLARRLGVPFADTDKIIEGRAGCSIADLFVTEGEPAFRELERGVVCDVLRDGQGVVSLGGGSVLDPRTREDLAEHTVVWLKVSVATAVQRVGMNTARPLLLGNVRSTMTRLLNDRNALYAEVATLTIDTDGKASGEIVTEVTKALEAVR